MSGPVFTVAVALEVLRCSACGVPYGVTSAFIETRRGDGKSFNCPAGHSQSFVETDVDRLTRKLDAALADVERQKSRAALAYQQVEHVERRLSAAKGRITKLKGGAR